jgi:YfiH family protein
VVDLPWTWLRQVHGAGVVVVEEPGQFAGAVADAAVTSVPGAALAVGSGDCAPVALLADGAVGVVHAGWRGLVTGVIPAAVAALRGLGATDIRAVLGPCIHAGCYEFGEADLDGAAAVLGDCVRGRTTAGTPALDVPAAVAGGLAAAGVGRVEDVGVCTACSTDHWSYRARGDRSRQALVAWLTP